MWEPAIIAFFSYRLCSTVAPLTGYLVDKMSHSGKGALELALPLSFSIGNIKKNQRSRFDPNETFTDVRGAFYS